jgi:hypothetical protein
VSEIDELKAFAQDIQQEVLARSDAAEEGALRPEMLSEVLLEHLSEYGETVNPLAISFEARGIKCSGFALSDDKDRLDLFVTVARLDGQADTITKADVQTAFGRLRNFLVKAFEGIHKTKEEASDSWDMLEAIFEAKGELSQVRLFVLTDGLATIENLPPDRLGDLDLTFNLWDLRRFNRAKNSGKGHEPVSVDFKDIGSDAVKCIVMAPPKAGYRCFLAIMSGELLVAMYQKFGPRLLERNVRSFLQLKGKINQGIRKTIIDEPQMFLAFNNGLSVTARGVKIRDLGDGVAVILSAKDFQIVNGGQTAGSIFRAARKDKADISALSVMVKITEILSDDDVDLIAPRISQSANAQNKVNMTDFSSNNAFHRKLESVSRNTWAPPAAGGGQRQSRWFFERARGQYNDELAKNGTLSQSKAWEAQHPRKQLITKTDLAKFEHCWSQLPFIVSKGAEKCYLDFMDRLDSGAGLNPDDQYFKRLVALAIVFRRTDQIVMTQKYGGYKANITAYTVSLLSYLTSRRLDLAAIWNTQNLDEELEAFIRMLSVHVQRFIIDSAGSRNVSEWCKDERSWEGLKALNIELSMKIKSKLITREQEPLSLLKTASHEQLELVNEITLVTPDTWFALSAWAKDTQTFAPWERSLSYSLGKLAGSGKSPSIKQATQGVRVLAEARRQGFTG